MRRLLSIVGLLLFVGIVAAAGPRQIAASFAGANFAHLAIALAFSAGMALAKSIRWRALLAHAGLPTPLLTVARYFLVGNFLGLATPGRVGDFAKGLYLAGKGDRSFARATATVFVDRVLDITVILLLGAAVLLHHAGALIAFPIACALLLIPLLAAKRRVGERFLRRTFEKVAPLAHRDRVGDEFAVFYEQVSALLTRGRLAFPFALAVLAYVFLVAGVAWITSGLKLEVPVSFVATTVVLAIFAALVPISVGGLGSREAVLIASFAQRGLPASAAISVSITLFAIFYLAPAVAGAIFWQKDPVPIPALR